MQVSFHEIKNHVEILVVLCLDHLLQFDYVLVVLELLQENNLPECSLSICGIVEGVKNLRYYV
jgi:hypothetical protein